jgi:hypothetical protein
MDRRCNAHYRVLTVLAIANGARAQTLPLTGFPTNFPMVGITNVETLRLNIVAWPPPSASCIAELGFQDSNGNPLGATKLVTLTTG